jgi:hypothetical protein
MARSGGYEIMTEKYTQTDKFFEIRLPVPDDRRRRALAIVQPFNGEADPVAPKLSWSHGFTHMRIVGSENSAIKAQGVYHAGQDWFEKNAREVPQP